MAKGQVKFVVITVDYFTKCAEAEPLATITEKKMEHFVMKNILNRFGILWVLVNDNGIQLAYHDPGFLRLRQAMR